MATKIGTLVKEKPRAAVFKELDLATYQWANNSAFDIIKKDPVLNWWLQLDVINKEFEEIHRQIAYKPVASKFPILTRIPLIKTLISWWLDSNKLKWFEWKLSSIFISYDENYTSLVNSSKLYQEWVTLISNKIEILQDHLKEIPLTTDDQKLYAHWVENLIWALTWTKARMIINLDTAEQIRIQMKLNRPIFKTIIDSLVIEKTWEIGLRAAQKSIDVMNSFIERTSSDLTDNTIAFAKDINANKFSTSSRDIFINNLNKLSQALKEIESIKAKAVADFDRTHWVLTAWETRYSLEANF